MGSTQQTVDQAVEYLCTAADEADAYPDALARVIPESVDDAAPWFSVLAVMNLIIRGYRPQDRSLFYLEAAEWLRSNVGA